MTLELSSTIISIGSDIKSLIPVRMQYGVNIYFSLGIFTVQLIFAVVYENETQYNHNL